MPIWPESVPVDPTVDQFRVLEITRPVRWTEMEDGPPIARKSGAGRRTKIQYRLIVNRTQMNAFRVFFEDDCADGTARFSMPVWSPATGTLITRTAMFDQGQATIEPFGLDFSLSFALIVFDWN